MRIASGVFILTLMYFHFACIPQPVINNMQQEYDHPEFGASAIDYPQFQRAGSSQQNENSIFVKEFYIAHDSNSHCLVIELNRLPEYKSHILQNPHRLFIDLLNTTIHPSTQVIDINDGIIERIRTGQHQNDAARIVLDTAVKITSHVTTDPECHRINLHFYPSETDGLNYVTNLTSNDDGVIYLDNYSPELAPDIPTPAPTLARELGMKVRTIIIDPGHGGKDPGAVSRAGVNEKKVTLDIAQRLKNLIEKESDYRVMLTREDDIYLPLEQRTTFANENKGDLFISIHVNSHSSPDKSGIETYFLSLTDDEEARAVAMSENRLASTHYSELDELISRIMTNTKVEESKCFAEIIQRHLIQRTDQTDRGVKKAGFVVLVGANMPAILVEVAFLSNPRGEELVQSKFYRHMVAEAIFQGIQAYSEQLIAMKN